MTILEKVLRWIVLIGVFALPIIPLYVANSLFFPFITGKNFAFRIIVEIMAGSWLALALISPKYRPRRDWVLGALALFVLVIAIADAQGAYPFKSFWSNYERMDGWVTIAHLLLYTVVASVMVNSERLWRWLFQCTLGISMLVSIYGLLQLVGFFTMGAGGTSGLSGRVDATFGNPIYMAVYMLFHIFIAAMLWAQAWVERGRGKRMPLSIFYGTIIFFDTVALFLTGTRGTMIGLIVGTALAIFLMLLLARHSRNAWRASVAALVGIFVLAGGFWMVRDAAWVHKIGFLQRLATISMEDATTKARFMNWGMAWEGVKERPILGWGQENYALVFDKYYNPGMYAQEQWFDRVHNIIFDWLVAGGFLGLISYLLIFVAVLWAVWRRGAHGHHVFTIAERSILTGLLAGYSIHNFFVFDNVTSYILFGTVLAYIVWRSSEELKSASIYEGPLLPRTMLPAIVAVLGVAVWGVAYEVNGRAYAANRELIAGIQLTSPTTVLENLKRIQKAIDYGTFGTQEAREQLAQITTQLAPVASVSQDAKRQFLTATVEQMKLQSEASPLDPRFPLFAGVALGAYGDYVGAAAALQKAHELSLAKQTILFEVGSNAIARNDAPAALQAFKKAHELEPTYDQARILYAALLIRTSNDALADEVLAPIVEKGAAADDRIAAAYAARGMYGKIITIWQAKVKASPEDMQARFTLAAATYATGNKNGAIAILEEAKRMSPGAADQANAFIQQIKDGTANVK
ncbi:tetratricopeptide repeat protein [Candidatus Kaiserbacteria bacterium]|nr:tetratricopeptide repeat protein [Candidatus Kaiserbacteria bacterium]